jgi:hypothetical protein
MTFVFDAVFDSLPGGSVSAQQAHVYEQTGRLVLHSALRGINGCLFAYGQTGSGKTFSMLGTSQAPGMLPRLADELFSEKSALQERDAHGNNPPSNDEVLIVKAAFLELYNERLVDLLEIGGGPLKLFENSRDGVTVPGLSETEVQSRAEFGMLVDLAAKNRAAGTTRMNKHSSRSHAIVQLRLHRCKADHVTRSKIHVIDLAGSERPRTGINGSTPNKEGININVSLSTLGLVISRLSATAPQRRSRCSVPYRDSKLTFLLKDSLAGNARTQVLVTLSPGASSFEESMSSLRFAQSAKRISTRHTADVAKSSCENGDVQALQLQVNTLRAELATLKSTYKCCPAAGGIGAGDAGAGASISSSLGEHLSGSAGSSVGQNSAQQASVAGRKIEVSNDGWFHPSDGDLSSVINILAAAGYSADAASENCSRPTYPAASSTSPGTLTRSLGSHKPSKETCPSSSTAADAINSLPVSDVRLAEAIKALKEQSQDSPSLAKVRLAVPVLCHRDLDSSAALQVIQALVSLCAQIDEANQLLECCSAAGIGSGALQMEATWLSPGANIGCAARDLLRVKVVARDSDKDHAEELWSLADFETQLHQMRKKIDSGTTLEAECSFGLRLGSKLIDEIPHTLVSTSETLSPVTAVQDNSTACQSPSSFAQILSPSTRDRGRKVIRSSRGSSEDMMDISQRYAPWSGRSTPEAQATPEARRRALPRTPEDRKRPLLQPHEAENGWSVSLCERVAICYSPALPSKEIFKSKPPRPVSPEGGIAGTPMVDELMLSQPRTDTVDSSQLRGRSEKWDRLFSESPARSATSILLSNTPNRSAPRTPRQGEAEDSSAADTLAAARVALTALTPPKRRPQSADTRYTQYACRRPWRSLTPRGGSLTPRGGSLTPTACSARRRGSSAVVRRLGVSAGHGDPGVVAGAFDRNSLRRRNGQVFVNALESWRTANAHLLKTPVRQMLPGTCSIYVRKRPMFDDDVRRCDFDVLTVIGASREEHPKYGHEVVHHACLFDKSAVTPFIYHTRFPFDGVFGSESTNGDVYCTVARPLLVNALGGKLSTLFVFGQTATGKTHTMRALEQLAAEELFTRLKNIGAQDTTQVTLSCFELAGRKALDLLTDTKVEIRLREEEDGCFRPHDCREHIANNAEELLWGLRLAGQRRATDATPVNCTSSRSHSVSRITIQPRGQAVGQLLLVDCAGLERARDTLHFRGHTQRESADINASLFALKDCIRFRQAAINRHGGLPVDGSLRLPSVRASPLTKVLAESLLSSSAQMAAIATVSPNATDTEHTIDTLRNIYTLGGRGDAHLAEDRQWIE